MRVVFNVCAYLNLNVYVYVYNIYIYICVCVCVCVFRSFGSIGEGYLKNKLEIFTIST